MASIVFLTVFLGLVSGKARVALQVDASIASVRLELDGRPAAQIDRAPWSAVVDFGKELAPRQLVAVGLDAEGKEVGRAAQTLNVQRRPAEADIVVTRENDAPASVRIIPRHRAHERADAAELLLDGKTLALDGQLSAPLPQLDPSQPHILSAEVRFADEQVARSELVIEGGYSGAVGAELTPVAVASKRGWRTPNLRNCFSSNGVPLRVAAVEKPRALLTMVRDPEVSVPLALRRAIPVQNTQQSLMVPLRTMWRVQGDAGVRIEWPVSRSVSGPGEPPAELFDWTNEAPADETGILFLMMAAHEPETAAGQPRRYADAVAVAGLSSAASGRRRAIVLLLGNRPDASVHAPAVVRRYLGSIGVPLFVWSTDPQHADRAWGAAEDVSTPANLAKALIKLNIALAEQRIVWLAADPIAALNAAFDTSCRATPLAMR